MSNERALTHEGAIAAAVRDALASDPATAPYRFDVAAIGTTVTLQGRVPSPHAKRRAERIVRDVAGVIDVTNEVEIISGSLLGEDAAGLGLAAAAGLGTRGGSGSGSGFAGLAAAQLVGATGETGPAAEDDPSGPGDAGPLNDWEG